MSGPLFISSGDLIADRRYDRARAYAADGDLAAAADLYAQAVELQPRFASAWFALGETREALGDRDGARAAFEQARNADPGDRHGAALHLARLGAADPATQALHGYVRTRLVDRTRTVAHRFIADGDIVVIEAKGDNVTPEGVRYDNDYCLVFRLEDGKIMEIREYCDSVLTEKALGPFPQTAVRAAS